MIRREPIGSFGSGHVWLEAWSESENDAYVPANSSSGKITAIKLDYYGVSDPASHSRLLKLNEKPTVNEDYNNIILESDVLFSEFYKKLAASDFRSGYTFNMYKSNCVDSVIFALNAANIKLNFKKDRSCKYLICCFFAYTSFTKPVEVLEAARAYKKTINNENSPLLPQVMQK